MRTTINNRLNEAFEEIAKENGISRNDFTDEENLWIGRFVSEQISYISSLADDIEENSKANGGKLAPLIGRADMWADRYSEVQSRAKAFFDGDGKYEWQYGPTEHCVSCLRLNGIVKRGSFWRQAAFDGVHPKSKSLACKGYRCQCGLFKTTKPVSRGPLPRI